MARTAIEKLNADKKAKKVILDFPFGGMKPGQTMFVGTPKIIDRFIQKIPFGQTRTIYAMRNALARQHKSDGMCPVSTAIFVRTCAEAALERLDQGATLAEVTPFWRLIDSSEKIAKRLPIDPAWLDEQRALEAAHENAR